MKTNLFSLVLLAALLTSSFAHADLTCFKPVFVGEHETLTIKNNKVKWTGEFSMNNLSQDMKSADPSIVDDITAIEFSYTKSSCRTNSAEPLLHQCIPSNDTDIEDINFQLSSGKILTVKGLPTLKTSIVRTSELDSNNQVHVYETQHAMLYLTLQIGSQKIYTNIQQNFFRGCKQN